jgi:segregation and condensation protein A
MANAYRVRLAQFEGPLDLLLHLIQKAKIELQDIFLSEITEQYLAYMEEIGEVDMDRASDFLNMAAALLYIKSRSLLPVKRDEDEGDEDYVDPETELLNRLRAYKLYKEASFRLAELEGGAARQFYKLPEELFEEREYEILDAEADALYRAFLSLIRKRRDREAGGNERVDIRKDSFSVRRQKRMILDSLRGQGGMSFFMLFREKAGSMEVAVTFLALLELWHTGAVTLRQAGSFRDIRLEYAAEDMEGG